LKNSQSGTDHTGLEGKALGDNLFKKQYSAIQHDYKITCSCSDCPWFVRDQGKSAEFTLV